MLYESGRKPNKVWVNKGSKVYNRSMKLWFQDNDIEMYSTYYEGKFVVAEIFLRTLRNKIYKYMTWILKDAYINKSNDIVNE